MNSDTATATMLDWALAYATVVGIRVIPCWWLKDDGMCACGKTHADRPQDAGKHPVTRNGLSDATTDPILINRRWSKYPKANIGGVPGPKYNALDNDPWRGGGEHKVLAALEAEHGEQIATLRVLSGRHEIDGAEMRGCHYWFHASGEFSSKHEFSVGEAKCEGGYVMLPPSYHRSGVRYELDGFEQTPEAIADAFATVTDSPAWLFANETTREQPRGEGPTEAAKLADFVLREGYFPTNKGTKYDTHRKLIVAVVGHWAWTGVARRLVEPVATRALLDDRSNLDGTPWTEEDAKKIFDSEYKDKDRLRERVTLPPPQAPMDVARELIKQRFVQNSIYTLTRHGGIWREWEGPRWADREQRTLRQIAYTFTEHAVYSKDEDKQALWMPTARKISDLLDALDGIVHLPATVLMPSWLDGRDYEGLIVAVSNGLLDVGTRELIPHTPHYFNSVAVPFPYDRDAPEPERWLGFLHDLWADDKASIALLQEWFGYVISGRTDLQKILLIVGPTRGGKGVIARVLGALVGEQNVGAPTLNSLQERFGLMPLLSKALAVVSDVRLERKNARVVVERLLSVSGEDLITVDRKNTDHITAKMPARFVLLSNELPQFGDASAAIVGRFVTLMLSRSWLGDEDPDLENDLHAPSELSGILNWALDGLERLYEQGRFTRTPGTAAVTKELVELASPVRAFIDQRCVVGPDYVIATEKLFDAWTLWAVDNGYPHGADNTFGSNLRSATDHKVTRRQRRIGGRLRGVYVGIDLNQSDDARDAQDAADDDDGADARPRAPSGNGAITARWSTGMKIDLSKVRRPKAPEGEYDDYEYDD